MPFPSARKKITLEEIDCPEYWCEFKTMTGMKYRDVKKMINSTDANDDEADHVGNLLKQTILSWNLPEEDGGEVLPIPSQDETSAERLPNIVVNFLVEQISGSDGSAEVENLEPTS